MKYKKYYLHLPNNTIGFLGKTVFFPLFIILINVMLVLIGIASDVGLACFLLILPITVPLLIYFTWANIHNFLDYFYLNDNDEIVLKRYKMRTRTIPLSRIKEVIRLENHDISMGAITEGTPTPRSFAVVGYNGEIFFYVMSYKNMKDFFTENNIPFITSL